MSDDRQDQRIAPKPGDQSGDGGERAGPIRDPLAWMGGLVSEDPSLAELIAFRHSRPDLSAFAREAKRCQDEADRMPFGLEMTREQQMAKLGLKIVSLGCAAIVAIWPCDTLEEADAKQALARETRMQGDDADYGMSPMLSPGMAARIRLHRAAFAVGEGIVPPAPPRPMSGDRGLSRWPLSRLDLVDLAPRIGGEMTLSEAQVVRWAGLIDTYPAISDCVDRLNTMIAIADRLDVLADGRSEDATDLRRAAEGARILGYLAAAQAAIWPALLHSADAAAKLALIERVNERACRRDRLHQQAAIRHLVSEANWIARGFRFGATLEIDPDWIPIV